MKQFLKSLCVLLFCLTATADDCPPPLTSMSTVREILNGLTHTLAIADNETRYVETTYVDNRNNPGYYWFYSGVIRFENLQNRDATMKFRFTVPAAYLPGAPTETSNVCYESLTGELVVQVEAWVEANGFTEVEYSGYVLFEDLTGGADLNGDYAVNGQDLGILYSYWLFEVSEHPDAAIADLNGDGIVNGEDLGLLLMAWTDSSA